MQLSKRGSLQLAVVPEEEAELRLSAEMLTNDSFQANLLDKSQLPKPSSMQDSRWEFIFQTTAGGSRPVRQEHRQHRRPKRTRIFESTPVSLSSMRKHREMSLPKAAREKSEQASCVVATNARAGDLLPGLADKIDPVRGQMLATARQTLFDCPIYSNHGYDYWRQDPSGRIVLGGGETLIPMEKSVTKRSYESIQKP